MVSPSRVLPCIWVIPLLFLLSGCAASPPHDTDGSIHACFAPRQDCRSAFVTLVANASDVSCALYDIEDRALLETLRDVNASVVIDDGSVSEQSEDLVVNRDGSSSLMHNKFCVLDEKVVVTGSLNPTPRGFDRNTNNLLLLHSPSLAELYAEEYDELAEGTFSGGSRTEGNRVSVGNSTVEVLFCPEDGCRLHLMDVLLDAEKHIRFLTFSFTDSDIADLLVQKQRAEIDVQGVMEERRISTPYSVFSSLNSTGVDVVPDGNPDVMHHKVFIIDGETVVAGSYNPTLSGNSRNDENMLIIRDTAIAQAFTREFWRIRDKASGRG